MTPEERTETIQEARIFHLAAPFVLPMLARRKKVAFDRLMGKHRDGSTDFLTLVSELAVLNDLERDIIQKSDMYKTLEGATNGTARK